MVVKSVFTGRHTLRGESLSTGRQAEPRRMQIPSAWNTLDLEDETANQVEKLLNHRGWSRAPSRIHEFE
jgi:hypothetical protein